MTVLDVVSVLATGGTSSEDIFARDRPGRGDLRRSESGGQRGPDRPGDLDGPARSRGPGELDGPPGWAGRWRVAWPQGVHPGGHDPGGRVPHRSRQRVASGSDRA